MTTRQVQAVRTRNALFKTAIKLFEKKGFENVTVQEICKKINLSVGVFYHYFESKNDIIFELYKIADEYFRSEVSILLDKENCLERILQFFYYYAKYNQDRGVETVKFLYSHKNKGFIAKGRYMQALVRDIIKTGQEKGEIVRDMTPEQICDELFIIARGVVFDWCLCDGDYDLVEGLTASLQRVIISFGTGANSSPKKCCQ